jgi:hypothetical protein
MNIKIAGFLLIGFFSTSFMFHRDTYVKSQNPDFVLIKKDNNISIYEKWIKVDDTRSARQFKVEFMVNASFEKTISVIKDDKIATKWMKSAKTYYILKKLDKNNWYAYVQFSVPWPLNNQDCIIKYEILPSSSNKRTEIRLTGLPYYLQKYKNVNRIMDMEGSWILNNVGIISTRVEYYIFSKQKPSFPRWITDPIMQNNLMSTMSAFRDVVNK